MLLRIKRWDRATGESVSHAPVRSVGVGPPRGRLRQRSGNHRQAGKCLGPRRNASAPTVVISQPAVKRADRPRRSCRGRCNRPSGFSNSPCRRGSSQAAQNRFAQRSEAAGWGGPAPRLDQPIASETRARPAKHGHGRRGTGRDGVGHGRRWLLAKGAGGKTAEPPLL